MCTRRLALYLISVLFWNNWDIQVCNMSLLWALGCSAQTFMWSHFTASSVILREIRASVFREFWRTSEDAVISETSFGWQYPSHHFTSLNRWSCLAESLLIFGHFGGPAPHVFSGDPKPPALVLGDSGAHSSDVIVLFVSWLTILFGSRSTGCMLIAFWLCGWFCSDMGYKSQFLGYFVTFDLYDCVPVRGGN